MTTPWPINVDGVAQEVPAGGTVLAALHRLGLEVPTLCNDERLRPHPVFRMCVVEVDGHPLPVPACSTLLSSGMVVRTSSPRIDVDRRDVLRMLARRHPRTVVEDRQEHPLAQYLQQNGLTGELRGETDPSKVDDSYPYIHVDMS